MQMVEVQYLFELVSQKKFIYANDPEQLIYTINSYYAHY